MIAMLLQGPLSVFCARARWGPVRVICLQRREGGLGLTLRGDSPVLVAGVVPGGCAAVRTRMTVCTYTIKRMYLETKMILIAFLSEQQTVPQRSDHL